MYSVLSFRTSDNSFEFSAIKKKIDVLKDCKLLEYYPAFERAN